MNVDITVIFVCFVNLLHALFQNGEVICQVAEVNPFNINKNKQDNFLIQLSRTDTSLIDHYCTNTENSSVPYKPYFLYFLSSFMEMLLRRH